MNNLKAFMSMPALANNAKDAVADFGEFSVYSQTFTRDLRNYAVSAQPDVELCVLQCIDSDGLRATPSDSFIGTLLAFGEWIYQQYIAAAIPADRNKATFVSAIGEQFPAFTNITIGELLVDTVTAGRNMPDYVQFKLLDGATNYLITIWFADAAFRKQYDVYEIDIIPPVDDISVLTSNKAVVSAAILERDQEILLSRIQALRGTDPETAILPLKQTWHDPSDPTSTLTTVWTALIYGAQGYDVDVMKAAARDYLAAHSTYTAWNTIYPDLYSETEFVVFPMWNKLALRENALEIGIYSGMVNNNDMRNLAKTFIPMGYGSTVADVSTYVDNMLNVGAVYYRALTVGILGNPNNKDQKRQITDIYPDYTALPTTNADFARMSLDTQGFVQALNTALDVARKFDPNDILETGYTRVVRKGMYFLSFTYGDYQYPILTKYTYDKITANS
ncbi:MAG: hypothetical protein [Bacteriophage sp.]|nr:MAG: hypothetical protein [Bacteriophage sp.]